MVPIGSVPISRDRCGHTENLLYLPLKLANISQEVLNKMFQNIGGLGLIGPRPPI